MSKNPFEDPNFGAPATSGKPASNPFDDPEFGKEPPSRGVTGWARDLGAWGLKGAIGLPEAAVGVADLFTQGKVGKALENEEGSFGLRFKEAKALANDLHSDTYKAKQQEFQNADGVGGKAKVALTNPDLIAGTIVESLPSMVGGGAVGRGLLAIPKLVQMGAKGAAIAGAAGEGVVGAGSAAEQIRQQTDDGFLTGKQAALAAGTGLATGALGFAGNKVANRLGIGDADMMLAQGTKGMAKDAAERATAAAVNPLAAPAQKSILRQVGEGAVTEGVLEELPQSVSEQILQNEALGKTWSEGLDEAIVMGILSGGAMGAGAAGFRGFKDKQIHDAAQAQQGAAAAQSAPGAETPQPAAPNWTTSAGVADPAAQQAGTAPASPANAPNLDYETPPGAAPEAAGNEIPFEREFDTAGLGLQSTDPSAPSLDKTGALAREWDTGNLSLAGENPQPVAPSVSMGLDASKGGLTKAAALAVDSGAAPIVQQPVAPVAPTAEQAPAQPQAAPQVPDGVDPETGEITLQAQMDELKGRIAFMQQQGAAQGWNKDMVAQRNALQSQLTKLEVQSAKEHKQGASTTGAPAPVKLTGITQILTKQIPAMSEQELQQAIAHYGPNHKRTKKLEKALQALSQKTLEAIETGANGNVSQADQAQQSGAQPAQAGAAQASAPAVQGVNANASPAQYDGAQAPVAPAAKSQTPSPQAAPAKQVNAAEAIAKEGNAQREQERQRLLDASERWTRMTTVERQAVTGTAPGLNAIARKKLHTRAWADIGEKVRGQLLDSLVESAVAPAGKAQAAIESEAEAAPVKPAAQPMGDEKPFAAETGTLGIPRADMPQVPTANHGGLVKHLNAQGIAHETTTVDAAQLKPTQAEYSPSKVEAAKSATGDRAVIVSKDGHIIDGHHQAVAAAEEGKQVKAIVLDAPVEKALEAVKASPSANADRSAPAASPKPRHGMVGGKLEAGEVVLTASGRETSPFPKIAIDTNRKAINTLKLVDQWLMQNALDEARARSDDFNAQQFESALFKPQQADKDSAEEYLFGEQPKVVPSMLRPVSAAKTKPDTANDRDHFTLERMNRATGEMEPVTFERGQTVKIAAGQKPYSMGVITGISHADRKFKVDGREHGQDFGYAYPAEYDEFAAPRAEVDEALDGLAKRLESENSSDAQATVDRARKLIEQHNLGDYGKERMADLLTKAAEVSKSVLDKMKAAKARKEAVEAQKRAEEQAAKKPLPDVVMTMDEWKAEHKDFKSIVDGQRMVLREGGMRKVVIDKPKSIPAKVREAMAARADYFTPGNIVHGYGNTFDRVMAYNPPDDQGRWSVTVQEVKKQGDTWVDAPNERERTHTTQPSKQELSAGPLERAQQQAQPEAKPEAAPASFLERHNAIEDSISAGTLALDAYKSAFAEMDGNRDEVLAELQKLTKDQLLKAGGPMFAYRMRDDKKDAIVLAAYQSMLDTYALGRSYGPNSYFLSADSIAKNKAEKAQALRELVANTTAEDLAATAAEIKAARDEFKAKREAHAEALANPKTLQDFRGFMSHWTEQGDTRDAAFLRLTPEQRQQYDALEAEQTKDSREAAKRRAQVSVASAGNTTAGEVIATKHTKHGHDLFVVQLAERVERDAYDTLNSSAKRMGGSYSSYRGGGAVPGFQFRTREAAEAFQKLVGGDTAQAEQVANERRDAFADDKSQTAVERLRTMADALDQEADQQLNAERKTNTARRARMASAADEAARGSKAYAGTMRALADAIEAGSVKFLDGIRTKTQLTQLQQALGAAKAQQLFARYGSWSVATEKKHEPMDAQTVDFAEFPRFTMFRSDLAGLARQLLEIEGGKKMGAALARLADDVSDAYTSWAKDNLLAVSHFGNKTKGGFADYATKDMAERAIKKSGLVGKAVVLQVKRGQNRIVLSPGEAMQQGLWQGDGDKRIHLGMEFVEDLAKLGKRKGSKVLALPWQLESTLEKRQRLQRMGIQTPAEFRSALRELQALRQERAEPDRIKELERAMVGRANDGLDFFPTSPAVVQSMLDAAEIAEGMAVLEPSAGMGHIADAIVAESGVWPDVVELSPARRELLEAKGYQLAEVNDFTQMEPRGFFTFGDTFRAPDGVEGVMRGAGGLGSQRVALEDSEGNRLGLYDRSELVGVAQNGAWSGYDRIIMNPPFSDGRDIQHVQHAYSLLRPGGRIVAIMGEGAFFQSNKRAEAFREWLDERGATHEKLPDGSFMDPSLPVNTGVAARMVVIDKPAADMTTDGMDAPSFRREATDTATGADFDVASFLQIMNEGQPNTAASGSVAQRAQPRYSPAARAEAVRAVTGTADAIRQAWANGPEVIVAFDMQDPVVPESARRADLKQRSGGARGAPEGFYYQGKVYLMASKLKTPNDAARVLFHEALGHHGLRDLFGKDLGAILNQVATMRKAEVDAKIEEYGLRRVNRLDRRTAAEEVLAEMAQNTPELGFVRRAVAAIRTWLRTHVPGFKSLALTDAELIRNFILPARAWVERGGSDAATMPQSTAFSRSPMKSVDANVERGRQSLARAITERTTVHRAMFRNGLGWVDFVWGSEGVIKSSGRTKGGMGLSHILEARQRKDGLTESEAVQFLDEVVATIAQGREFQRAEYAPATRVGVEHENTVVWLTQRKGGNAWIVTGYEKVPNGKAAGRATAEPTHQAASLTRDKMEGTGEIVDESGDDGNVVFSRSRFMDLKDSALDQLSQTFTHEGKVSLWDKTVGTMRNLAERAPAFKPVYEAASQNIDDVSMLANDAADMAPRILPRVETLGDLKKKPVSATDNKAIAKPLFEGTLIWARDENGKPALVDDLQKRYANLSAHNKAAMLLKHGKIDSGVLAMWQGKPLEQFEKLISSRFESKFMKPGLVWEPEELQKIFGLSGAKQPDGKWSGQVSLYQEARAAIDRSIDMTARTDMLRVVGEDYADLREVVLAQPSVESAAQLLLDTLQDEAKANPDAADRLGVHMQQIKNRMETAADLQAKGYTPLSRFGRYTVDVVDANGERQYFGMYESQRESNLAKMQLASEFKGATITQGTMSAEAYKLFAGVTPETLEQFGEMLGLKAEGNEAQDKAFQEFLKLTKNNHSAMKRLIHRQGIAGFSEDVGRVVANFVYSNARAGAMGLNAGKMDKAIGAIPKEQGELKDLAMGLRDYIRDPQEEGQAVRGMLFAQYLGGSIASAFVNTTQPFAVTLPWLSQYGGMKKAGAQLARALKDMGTKGFKYESDLAKALQSAEDDGTVSPQEIHQLMAQARGAGMLRSGDGTKAGNLRAQLGNKWEQGKVLWGQPFALAEQFNRRSTFIAAYRTAKEQGIANPGEFARNAVIETQFQYSKANKPRWARGAVGGTLFTFKTYSVSYLELMNRMWTQGGPEGKRAVGWALAMLLLMSGAGGVPFMEDAEDLIDGAGQLMGYNISAKQWRKELLADVVGKELAEFMEQGLSGLPGAPVDVSGRLGMGNLLPGTGLFLNKPNRERDLMEIVGPAGDLVSRGFTGARKLLGGDVAGAALEVSPTAVRNLAKGADMAATGMYRDTKGYKVIDTTLAEAAAKAIGFQPKSVAEVQEANSFMLRSKSFYTQTSSDIKAQWADALFRKDEAALERVRERLADWNRDNPDQPIVVRMPDVWKRVREMGKDRSDRIADTAPKALRAQMRQEVAAMRG